MVDTAPLAIDAGRRRRNREGVVLTPMRPSRAHPPAPLRHVAEITVPLDEFSASAISLNGAMEACVASLGSLFRRPSPVSVEVPSLVGGLRLDLSRRRVYSTKRSLIYFSGNSSQAATSFRSRPRAVGDTARRSMV